MLPAPPEAPANVADNDCPAHTLPAATFGVMSSATGCAATVTTAEPELLEVQPLASVTEVIVYVVLVVGLTETLVPLV